MAKKTKGAGKRSNRKRRGKGEDMTGAKEGAVEMRQATLEVETVQLSSEDFHAQLKAYKGAFDKFQTAKRLLDGVCKQAKKISPDMLSAVKLASKVERADANDIKTELAIYGFVLKEIDHQVQIVLHDTLLGDVTETAYKRGFADGEGGKTASTDYPEGSDLAQEYARGWRHGTSKNLGLTPEQSDAAIKEDTLWNNDPPHLADKKNGGAEASA